MNDYEFEQFVQENGNDILSFCKMHTMSVDYGNELYQDTMLKLLEKQKKLDSGQNVKAYALSVAIFIWKNKKKKYLKRNKIASFHSLDKIIALAACAAVCFSGHAATNYWKHTSLEKVSDAFTVKVYAQELTSDNSISISGDESVESYVMGSSETEGTIYYCINLPFSCEGDNIKNITYSINKGCFQIVEADTNSYLVDYVEHTGDDTNFGLCGGFGDEALEEKALEEKVWYLDSFTVDYNKQTGEDFWVNVGNVVPDMQEAIDLIWNSDGSWENSVKATNMLLSEVEITITATYEDGTESSKVIGLESKVVEVNTEKGLLKMNDIFVKEL